MRRPSGDKFGQTRPFVVRFILPVQKRLLGKIVATAESSFRIKLGELCVGHRGEKGEDQRKNNPGPDVGGNRSPVRRRGGGLQLIGDPKKRPRRNQRHRVHGNTGLSKRWRRCRCFTFSFFFHEFSSKNIQIKIIDEKLKTADRLVGISRPLRIGSVHLHKKRRRRIELPDGAFAAFLITSLLIRNSTKQKTCELANLKFYFKN